MHTLVTGAARRQLVSLKLSIKISDSLVPIGRKGWISLVGMETFVRRYDSPEVKWVFF